MRTCLLCGGTESVHRLVFSRENKLAFEEQYPDVDLEAQLASSGICNDCFNLPREMRDQLIQAANRAVLHGFSQSRRGH